MSLEYATQGSQQESEDRKLLPSGTLREREKDMAVGAVSSEPVSPLFSSRTSWANNSRMRDGSRQVPQ